MNLNLTPLNATITKMLGGAVMGLAVGWWLWRPIPAQLETWAPGVTQPDSSIILQREPNTKAKPAQQIPKGSTVERIVRVVVQSPTEELPPIHGSSGIELQVIPSKEPAQPCPPVTVDLSLVRMKDKTLRVIASSPDGYVIPGASIDIPVINVAPIRRLKNAIGVRYEVETNRSKTFGLVYQRDIAFARLSIDAGRNNTTKNTKIGVSILITF